MPLVKENLTLSIFEHALEIVGLSAEEVLMVGDNLMTDILGSSKVGIQSVWINREEKPVIEEIRPTYTIENLRELLTLLS